MATTPYATISEAQLYFDERLNTGPWDFATPTDQMKALQTATRAINRLRFLGNPIDPNQPNAFPRDAWPNTPIPLAIQQATCELALQLLDSVDPNIEIANIATTGDNYSMVRANYIRDFALPHIAAGIPSSEAWQMLLPFLADPLSVQVWRVN
jgi:hypothetical protein